MAVAAVSIVNAFSTLKLTPTTTNKTTFSTQFFPISSFNFSPKLSKFNSNHSNSIKIRRNQTRVLQAAMILPQNPVMSDICALLVSSAVALSTLAVWQLTAKYQLFDSKLNRKLVHISIGLVFLLCWPLFSSGYRGAIFASLVPGLNAIRVLLIGFGVLKDEDTVKSMSRSGDHRELLKGPFYYASTITFACVVFWRTSPIGVAAICNLCVGDGLADVVGRRFGHHKLPYNGNKSYAGTIAMAISGFLGSILFMRYFSLFGYMNESWGLVLRCLFVSIVSSLVESLPISTEIDDNLTVPLTSFFVGGLVF